MVFFRGSLTLGSGGVAHETKDIHDIVGDLPEGPMMELPLQPDAEVFAERVKKCLGGEERFYVRNGEGEDVLTTELAFWQLSGEEACCVMGLADELPLGMAPKLMSGYGGSFSERGIVQFEGAYPEDYEARKAASDAYVLQPQYWVHVASMANGRVDEVVIYGNGVGTVGFYVSPTSHAYGMHRPSEDGSGEIIYVVPQYVEDHGLRYEHTNIDFSADDRYVVTDVTCPDTGFGFERWEHFKGEERDGWQVGVETSLEDPRLSSSKVDAIYGRVRADSISPADFCKKTGRLVKRVLRSHSI